MKNCAKYQKSYFMPPTPCYDWVQKEYISAPPTWCSVDLRDGNQALIEPMSLEEKLEFFKLLVKIGFKEIEVGFPAASDTEYEFLRALIEGGLVPEDVTLQVLTQAREHIIRKTFDALKGAPRAIVHLYNSTSVAQREQVFKKDKDAILKIAVDGAKLLNDLANETEGNFSFEYSPESFTGTEPEYALEVCNAVLDVWKPAPERKVIVNLPATVETSLPHVYASQIEYMHKNLKYRENVVISLHPHNDRGTGVADAELGILAGGDRIEGTLFGNGERTGNVDIITLAMNMYSHGVDPKLDFSQMPEICEVYERLTGMKVSPRAPYCGSLVFAAFSGSHQDAIAKGIAYKKEHGDILWSVPYLPIDPEDVGRTYDSDVIRINSQSGKGGVGYILEEKFGLNLPAKMKEDMGYTAKSVSDVNHKELSPEWIHDIFMEKYVQNRAVFDVTECHFSQIDGIKAFVSMQMNGEKKIAEGQGNGRLNAVMNAIKEELKLDCHLVTYEEHALTESSRSKAIAYVGVTTVGSKIYWGAGIHEDIITASIAALVSALNNAIK
ncbi:MAG: 2-isopropylmalate synthase [Clostridia bacterium]|nr:2-isopropylmalate synthase [Clostridia bacterium]